MAKAPVKRVSPSRQKKTVKKRISRIRKATGVALMAIAFMLFALAGWLAYSYVNTEVQLQAAKQAALTHKIDVPGQSVAIKADTISGKPVQISIPSVGISQPVEPGSYDTSTGDWTLGYHAAYWASMTAPINSQTGNTFIYGHDVKAIFGNLLDAQTGAKAIIKTDNGYIFTYTLKASKAVDPTDTSLIQPTVTPTLTVQTCSGSWYQYRQLFTFTLDGYVKA
jgi:LPXTG-site transpeptidase (sortase) family protein